MEGDRPRGAGRRGAACHQERAMNSNSIFCGNSVQRHGDGWCAGCRVLLKLILAGAFIATATARASEPCQSATRQNQTAPTLVELAKSQEPLLEFLITQNETSRRRMRSASYRE